jgi:ABC-2 type transport system permease protein
LSLRTAYELAVVLTKSQLRGYQRRRLTARIFGDPRIILVLDALFLVVPALLFYMLSGALPSGIEGSLRDLEVEALAGIPTAIAFMVILFGVLSEISQAAQSMSTDLVNWLPITPSEYVAGSTMSLTYTYSFMLSFLLGVSLGPALRFGMIPVWGASALMSVLSLFIGACVVELLRSVTNRISSSFYKKSGRSGIFVRLALTIVVLVFVQLLFSGRIVVYLLQGIMLTVRVAWFVPVVWPSLAVLAGSQGDTLALAAFGGMTFVFFLMLFGLAVRLRAIYWVPIPVSIRLTNQAYHPLRRITILPGFGSAESAIFRKDMRSLTRRREMTRFLAIPFVLVVSLSISLLPISGTAVPEGLGFFALIPLYVIPLTVFSAVVSMTSLGQEGSAVWNIYVAPITARQLLKAKILSAVLLGLAFSVTMAIFLGVLLRIATVHIVLLVTLGIAIVLEQSAMGMYFGARFPDFREMIRSRFISVWGSLIGTFLCLLLAMLTALPILLSIYVRRIITYDLAIVTFAIGLILFFVGWKLAERQIRTLIQEIRV